MTHFSIDSLTRRRLIAGSVALGASVAVPRWGFAQTDPRIAEARKKGRISVYTPLVPEEMRVELAQGFKKLTGVDVEYYYGGTGQVAAKLITERRAGSYTVDVITLADLELVAQMIKDGTFHSYKMKNAPKVVGTADHDLANGYWYSFNFYGAILTYNPTLVKGADTPKSWEELADPKWKGKVVITDPNRSAHGYAFMRCMAAEKGWDWVDKMMRNDPLLVTSGPRVSEAVTNGERQLGLSSTPDIPAMIKAGAPIALADLEWIFTLPLTVSVVAGAPNLPGAELFVDYLLSEEAGALYLKNGYFSVRLAASGPPGLPAASAVKVRFVDIPTKEYDRKQFLDKFKSIADAARK